MFLTFTTEQYAIDAQRQIWINYVKAQFAIDKNMIGTGTVEYDSLDGLTDDEIAALKKYGIKNGEICKLCGLTTKYADIKKAYYLTKWYFSEPDPSLMKGVTDYKEEPFNPDWEPPYSEE